MGRRSRWSELLLASISILVLAICLVYTYLDFKRPVRGLWTSATWTVRFDQPGCSDDNTCLRTGDRILEIDGVSFEAAKKDRGLAILKNPESAHVLINRDGLRLSFDIPRQAPLLPRIAEMAVVATFSFVFWFMGALTAVLVRPRDERWFVLVAFYYVTALLLAAGFVSVSQQAYSSYVTMICAALFPALVVHLHLVLPNRAFDKLTKFLLPPLYLASAATIVANLFGARTPSWVLNFAPVAALGLSLGLFLVRQLQQNAPEIRAANRLMAIGVALGLLPWTLALAFLDHLSFVDLPLGTSDVVLAALVILMVPNWPLSYLFAIYKADTGSLQLRANRALGAYGFWSIYMLLYVANFLAIASSSSFITNQPIVGSLLVSLPFVTLAPYARRIFQGWIDRSVFGIRYSTDQVIQHFAARIPAAADREALRHALVDGVLPNLMIRQSALFVFDHDHYDLLYTQAVPEAGLPADREVLERLLGSRSEANSAPGLDSIEEKDPFDWIRIALPLISRGEQVGIWLLGRRDPDDIYPRQDIQTLRILANQIGALHRSQLEQAENRRLQDQLVHSQKMEAIGRLSAGVAHDFNNLLSAILGYSDLLLGVPNRYDAVSLQYLEGIKEAGNKAATLTSQLLAFSRQQAMISQVVDLNILVDHLRSLLRRVIEEDIDLRWQLNAETATVFMDPGQMEQVILNLVVNASDAMQGGGTMTLKTENVTVGARDRLAGDIPEGRFVRLQVIDSGVGIAPDVIDHIFEPFFTTKKVGKGTGLGLAMVYGTITQSAGHLRVASQVGKGTTFSLYLPIAAAEQKAPAVADQAKRRLRAKGQETILLVEDEASVRKVVCMLLRSQGYEVLTATDGADGLEVARSFQGKIDLLLSDVMMPILKGPPMATELLGERPDLAVIFMSGYSDEKVIGDLVRSGGATLLRKPFAPTLLAEEVRQALDRRQDAVAGG